VLGQTKKWTLRLFFLLVLPNWGDIISLCVCIYLKVLHIAYSCRGELSEGVN